MCGIGMVGYPEALTDPSYQGQILVLTYPLIGNYGVPPDTIGPYGLSKFFESNRIHINALIVADYSHHPSHYTLTRSLSAWLKEHNIPALYGLDTRALTKKIRERGCMLGKIVMDGKDVAYDDPNQRNLVAEVSCKEAKSYGKGPLKIIAVDCGIKHNIIRYLISLGVEVKVVPWNYDFNNDSWDGLFLSNGPGDPSMVILSCFVFV
jgi:carbamoyl-phosphate synthase small subunit